MAAHVAFDHFEKTTIVLFKQCLQFKVKPA